MKRNTIGLIFTFCLLIPFSMKCQDIIITQSGEEIKAKVLEINTKEVVYKKFDYQEGPTIKVSKSEIFMIKYPNGSKEVFNNSMTNSGVSDQLEIDGAYLLKAGTNIQIELAESINSKTISPGQVVYFRVKFDVDVQGAILIKAGQTLKGTVTRAEKAKGLGQQGQLALQISDVLAVDGQNVRLSGNIYREGDNKSAEAIGIGALIFWPVLFLKGEEAEILAGTIFNTSIGESIYIKP